MNLESQITILEQNQQKIVNLQTELLNLKKKRDFYKLKFLNYKLPELKQENFNQDIINISNEQTKKQSTIQSKYQSKKNQQNQKQEEINSCTLCMKIYKKKEGLDNHIFKYHKNGIDQYFKPSY